MSINRKGKGTGKRKPISQEQKDSISASNKNKKHKSRRLFTDEQIEYLKDEYYNKKTPSIVLASQFNTTRQSILRYVQGKMD